MRILLAEDELSLAKASSHVLEKNGFNVVHAKDGEEAIDLFFKHSFDLVLLDVMMPKKNGFEVLEEIRKFDKDIKIMMVTAKAEIDDKLTGFDNGADDYITKPYDFKELIMRINNILKTRDELLIFHDMVLDTENHILSNKSKENARCSLSETEVNFLKKIAYGKPVSKNVLDNIFDKNEDKLKLYIRFINNKFIILSLLLKIKETETDLMLEAV